MRLALLVVLVTACGKPAAPVKPTPPTTGSGSATTTVTTAPAAAATCAEAATILRGPRKKLSHDAAKAKEEVLEESCTKDKWAAEILKCSTSTADPQPCLEKLTAEQKDSLAERMSDWRDDFGEDDDSEVAEFDIHDFDPPPPKPEPEDDEDEYILCNEAVTAKLAKDYPAAPKETGADGDFVLKLRKDAYLHECNYADEEWSVKAKKCLRDGGDTETCMKSLEDEQREALAKASTAVDATVKKTFDVRKKPAAIGCPQVVVAIYGDAKWKDKFTKMDAKVRKGLVDQSRAALTKACTGEKWDPTARACLVANDAETCLGARHAWKFPARGIMYPTGIAECDQYIAEVAKLIKCEKMSKDQRDSIADSIDQFLRMTQDMSPSSKETYKGVCKNAIDAVKKMVTNQGC